MTPIWDCTDARPSLGVYVLGAIDPAERALVDAHLVTCRDCRDELAGLAGLPALGGVDGAEHVNAKRCPGLGAVPCLLCHGASPRSCSASFSAFSA